MGQGPALFAKANLRYLTKSPGRTPTLYFQSGATTGRMRTQHDTGPLADIDQYPTVRLFTQNKIVNFNGTYMESPGILKDDWTDTKYGHVLVPTDGYHQLEVHHQGNVYKGKHPSSGLVSTDLAEYTDEVITNIFNFITGKLRHEKKLEAIK